MRKEIAQKPLSRSCGTCNFCCTAMRIPSLDKPAGVVCQHQCQTGCNNYENRPDVCREWHCMWVRDTAGIFTDEHRPDRLGVFFTTSLMDPVTDRMVITAHELRPGAAAQSEAGRVIEFLKQFAPVRIRLAKSDYIQLTREHNELLKAS